MRIAQISTSASPVRRSDSQSIERVVWLLSEELVKLGHEVTIFACAGSESSARVVETLPGSYGAKDSIGNWQTCDTITLCRAIEESGEFDVMHSHAYLWGLPLALLSKSPMVHTLHVQPFDDEARLREMFSSQCVTALSRAQWSAYPHLPPAPIVHHGVDPNELTFRAMPDNYLCFLGRMLPEKGVKIAIDVARELGERLILAGPSTDYFKQVIEPLVDGKQIQYIGPVDAEQRDRLLGGAKALIYPLGQPEPFGMVQIEAMMCGTPVAAIGIGAVSEIIDEGVTGYSATSAKGLAAVTSQASSLNRTAVRRRAELRFSASRMAREYVEVFEALLKESPRAQRTARVGT